MAATCCGPLSRERAGWQTVNDSTVGLVADGPQWRAQSESVGSGQGEGDDGTGGLRVGDRC